MSQGVWDVVVVGAGVIGSWTAYHLASQGVSTLLLEQFPLPHTRGSSNGPTRIFKIFHPKQEYVKIAKECFEMWKDLEDASQAHLFDNSKMLAIETPPYNDLKSCRETMEKYNMEYIWLNYADLCKQYPMFKFTAGYNAVLDPAAGVMYSNKCVQVLQEQFKQKGGALKDGIQVTSLQEKGEIVLINTRKGVYKTKKVVLCPGPWATDLLRATGLDLPLKTMPGRQAYFRVKDQTIYDIRNGVPILREEIKVPGGYQFFIVKPMNEYPGYVKVATRGEPLMKEAHPNERDQCEEHDVYESLLQYVKNRLPYVDPKPCLIENCVYTMTPDQAYVVDWHPTMKNIIIGAGFSGSGFATAPVVGKLLSQMALHQPLSHDTSNWKINRFLQAKL